MTLAQFVMQCGGPVAASKKIGTTYKTVYRWLNGTAKPRGLYVKALERRGVVLK